MYVKTEMIVEVNIAAADNSFWKLKGCSFHFILFFQSTLMRVMCWQGAAIIDTYTYIVERDLFFFYFTRALHTKS